MWKSSCRIKLENRMPTVDVLDIDSEKVGEIVLRDDVFAVEPKLHLLHFVLRSQLAAKRRGTASTKTRSEVRSARKKAWRQKGTGRARVGARSSPLWRGGGVVFGPKPRDYRLRVPKKVKKAAVRSALSLKLKENRLMVLERFDLPEIRTKTFVTHKEKLKLANALIVVNGENANLQKSARNVPEIKVLQTTGLNLFDILRYDQLVLTTEAIAYIEKVYGS
jgi:large subunit ribosomal protein L4